MNKIFESILVSTGFEKDNENNFAYNNKKNMYFVYNDYKLSKEFFEQVNKEQEEFYEYISNLDQGNMMKKNTTFIIFLKLDNINEKDKIIDNILELEEDTYFFKKYVVAYTEEEYKSFQENQKDLEIINFMENTLSSSCNFECFEEFKKQNRLSYFSLILKLYIKIPYLNCGKLFDRDTLNNLSEQINENILNFYDKSLLDFKNEFLELKNNDIKLYINQLLECEDENV